MKVTREHNGIIWGTADLSTDDVLWPDGVARDEKNLVWIVMVDEFKSVKNTAGLFYKGVFCSGNGCDDFFNRIKRSTKLYMQAAHLEEAVRLAGMYARSGDRVVLTNVAGDKEQEKKFQQLISNLK